MAILADADPGYFYIATHLPNLNFKTNNIYIAIDTYDEEKGDHRLPFLNEEFENGIEFLLEFNSLDSAIILVDEQYSVFTDIYNDVIPVYASKKNSNAKFIHQDLLSNRGREGLFGEKTDSFSITEVNYNLEISEQIFKCRLVLERFNRNA